jgi:hypothetical protein
MGMRESEYACWPSTPAAFLVFLPAAAGTGIVSARFGQVCAPQLRWSERLRVQFIVWLNLVSRSRDCRRLASRHTSAGPPTGRPEAPADASSRPDRRVVLTSSRPSILTRSSYFISTIAGFIVRLAYLHRMHFLDLVFGNENNPHTPTGIGHKELSEFPGERTRGRRSKWSHRNQALRRR